MGGVQGTIRHSVALSAPGTSPARSRAGTKSGQALPAGQDRRLAKACADFEAIFVEQMFKTMRASIPEPGVMGGGRAEEIYTSLLDQQIAMEMAHGKGSVGLSDQMQHKLAPPEPVEPVTKGE